MKKRKKVLEVVHARAMSNGVKFYAQRQRGYIAISTVDENGTVKVQWCNKREYIKEKSLYTVQNPATHLQPLQPFR